MVSPSAELPLSWSDLQAFAAVEPDPLTGPTNPRSRLRTFGQPEGAVRVTLFRDHHAWCPYCQKVWMWLEERQVPYRVAKVTMFCYGEKEDWYRRRVPSGMLPAIELDGRLVTESDRILEVLEATFGSLGPGMNDPLVLPLRRLERLLFHAWCQWLCQPHGPGAAERARRAFDEVAARMAEALEATPGPFLLGDLSTADLVFVPYVERMSASLAYYKGYLLRRSHPAIDRWFAALEQRPTYLGTQSDFHTHVHDLPPQMGGCHAEASSARRQLAERIDHGPWPIVDVGPDPETSEPPAADATGRAIGRVLRHRGVLVRRYSRNGDGFDAALRCALTHLALGVDCPPPPGSGAALRTLRDRICVPRDMPLHAARRLRQALEHIAGLDPADPAAQGLPIPVQHRRDQDPAPFLAAAG